MAIDRTTSTLALALSLAAIILSILTMRRDPLGSDLSTYDLSSPEQTLRSINRMVKSQDLRAGLQLVKDEVRSSSDGDKGAKLFLSDALTITVLKSIELSNSGVPKNNGTIVSFVKFNISGVDYYSTQYFRKDQSGRFLLTDRPFAFGDAKTDSDKTLDTAIDGFEKTGKLN
ncbi:MAG: hypothetical protein WA800_05555 [Terriglobales bacterium]